MQLEKPFYSVKIDSQYCGYTVAINGCYVEYHREGSPLNMEYPVNQWLRTGKNLIEVYFYNISDPTLKRKTVSSKAQIKCDLRVKEAWTEQDKLSVSIINFSGQQLPREKETGRIDYNALEANILCENTTAAGYYDIEGASFVSKEMGEIKIDPVEVSKGPTKSIRISQAIHLNTPFPEWQFFKAEKHRLHVELSDDEWEAFRVELLAEYQKIHDAINSRDLNKLKPLIEDRSREYGQAFYKE